jgi:alkylated DNA repair dioxygenase AlkB
MEELTMPQAVNPIPGLSYTPNYVSTAEENTLLSEIDAQLWLTDLKRRVQHYGWRYDYRAKRVDLTMRLGTLPAWLAAYAQRLHDDGLIPEVPDQVIINEYVPGQGIASHVDCEPCFGETIVSLSLGSPCVMFFTHLQTKDHVPILLERGSLVVMQGEARHGWQHGILPRKVDDYAGQRIERGRRVSLTFRNVINPETSVDEDENSG